MRGSRGARPPATPSGPCSPSSGIPCGCRPQYSGRALHLIGPALYPDYIRLLRLLLAIVVPIVGVVVGAATAIAGADPWDVVAAGFGAAFSVGVQVAFWVTVVFAIIERRGSPAARSRRRGTSTTCPSCRAAGSRSAARSAPSPGSRVLIWFLLWQPGYQESFDPGGPSIPILDPALSQFWIPFLVAVLLASIALGDREVPEGSLDCSAGRRQHRPEPGVRHPGHLARSDGPAAQPGVPLGDHRR